MTAAGPDHSDSPNAPGIPVPPDSARLQQALALHQQGRLAQAKAAYEEILRTRPAHADALHLLGVVAIQSQEYETAVGLIQQAIGHSPGNAAFHSNLGTALKALNRLEEAVAGFNRAIQLKPDYAEAYSNRGNALQSLGRLDDAVASYDRAIALRPGDAEFHSNRGNALLGLNRADEALASHDRAIQLRPEHAEAHSNRGYALQALNRLDAAVASYDRAIQLQPGHAEAHWNKALTLLIAGDYENAWPLYEWRWKREGATGLRRTFPQPLWLGTGSLRDKTILLHSEQGLGDTLQFCRYATLVAGLGARVILEVPAPLAGLLRDLEGVAELIARGDPLPRFDFHCPLLSLPLAFRTTLANVPSPRGYLRADPARLSQWTATLGHRNGPRAGLVWSGSARTGYDQRRSLGLAQLLRHLPQDWSYVCLQKDLTAADREILQQHPNVRHWPNDFSDAAALVQLMDVVITVDTSLAHLSGALGQRTWVLLPFSPDWRWLLERPDSPWYPSARLFRQETPGDWESPLAKLAGALGVGSWWLGVGG
jgi:tetratricopeptide (TPR) repeat protein